MTTRQWEADRLEASSSRAGARPPRRRHLHPIKSKTGLMGTRRLGLRVHRLSITNYPITNFPITQCAYSIWTRPPAPDPEGVACWGARHESKIDTWCTHETVQCGAQDFSVRNSRRISATVYFSRGTAG
jgi:hypothetical protein